MAYFSYLVQLILFLFTKRQSQKGGGGGMAQCPPKYATNTGSVANVKGDTAQASFSIISLPIFVLRFTKTFSRA